MPAKKNTKRKTTTKKKTDAPQKKERLNQELSVYVIAIIAAAISIIAMARYGIIGQTITNLTRYLFGQFYYVVYIMIVIFAVIILTNKKKVLSFKIVFATICLLVAILLVSMLPFDATKKGFEVVKEFSVNTQAYLQGNFEIHAYGGLVGAILYALTSVLVAREGTYVVIIACFLLGAVLLIDIEMYKSAWNSIKNFFSSLDDIDLSEDEAEEFYEEEVPLPEVAKPMTLAESASTKPNKPTKKSLFMEVDDILETSDEVEIGVSEPAKPVSSSTAVSSNTTKSTTTSKSVSTSQSTPKSEGNPAAYRLPPLSLLEPIATRTKNNANQIAATQKGKHLIEVLDNFGIHAQLVATHIGPAVTKFEVKPDASVKVSKINSLSDNIKMELAARELRIEAPIPGKNAIGVEIPNVESTSVRMLEIMRQLTPEENRNKMLFALGKDLMGKAIFCRLDKMPHLLIAGATGSGKSVCMNTIITSFLLRCHPDEVKLLLIDPKKVEFTPYHNVPHLLGPVINDAAEASRALKVVVEMMDNRYELFSQTGVRKIEDYNRKVQQFPQENLQPMPYVVVIIDELADLMLVAGKEVEGSIQRITQLARAAGIHLIVATQRPSTDIITGVIKANIPSRIAFSVSSGIDSRTILDHVGAERLLGNGDMLYIPIGEQTPLRVQGVYVSDEEVARITDFVKAQGVPHYADAFIRLEGVDGNESTAVLEAKDDPMYEEIKQFVIESQKASTSLLQRRFGLGYNRAARMIDVLESRGIVGPQQGSKPREVYIKKNEEE